VWNAGSMNRIPDITGDISLLFWVMIYIINSLVGIDNLNHFYLDAGGAQYITCPG
jgi:hypothetical protein